MENLIFNVLRQRYPKTACALLRQVADRTGSPTRHADAIAMQLWPSRGLTIEGIEIKSSKADWKKELDNPAKADVIYRFCDKWWIAAPVGVVLPKDLPKTWGLIEINKEADGSYTQRTRIEAPENKDRIEPTRAFLAALLRALQNESVTEDELARARNEAHRKAVESMEANTEARIQRIQQDAERYKAAVRAFEEASGIRIDTYRADSNLKLGQAVRAVMSNDGLLPNVRQLAKQMQSSAIYLQDAAVKVLRDLEGVTAPDLKANPDSETP